MPTLETEQQIDGVPLRLARSALYYDFGGDNPDDMRRQIDDAKPDVGSGRWDAYTRWQVYWTFQRSQQGEQCQVTSAHVELNLTFMLPRWTPATEPTPELKAHWRRYMTSLITHEEGHANHGVACAREISAALIHAAGAPDCATLDSTLNAEAHRVVDKFGAEDVEYDYATQHGASQGAVFP